MLISEVMLQQTSVARVIPKFGAFLGRFPAPRDLAAAPLGDALVLWEGLGYPRRCRNLRAAATTITTDHDGEVPATLAGLLALPGVGPYTARAVLAFSHGRDVAVVDTNVARFLARLAGRPLTAREAQHEADALLPLGQSWEWNQIAMDFGATVCTARRPVCHSCALSTMCAYRSDPELEDPALTTAGTSRPQARFDGSDRQARGRAMRAVAAGPLSRVGLAEAMSLADDPARADRLIGALVDEGLLTERSGEYLLP